MVAREIGEAGGMEVHRINAAEVERMRGGFERSVRAARSEQLGEHAEQVERFRRGVHGGQYTAGKMIFDGANQRSDSSGGAQHGVEQHRGGSLSIRAGNGRERQSLV